MYKIILEFWFGELEPSQWWKVDPALDDQIKVRFLPIMESAARGELFEWRDSGEGRLAEIIVLDQFSRNVYRNTRAAFSQDSMALVLAQEAASAGVHDSLQPMERSFLFMPFMHSESVKIHGVAERLYKEFAPAENYRFELKHKKIIDRFGRFPHRNNILGRVSTAEEVEFLKQPGSGF